MTSTFTEPMDGVTDDAKQRLLEATIQLVGERGPDRVRLKDIAARAGYSIGAIYWFYRDRRSIVDAALVERYASRVLESIERNRANIESAVEGGVATQLGSYVRALLSAPEGASAGDERSMVFAAARRDAQLGARVREVHHMVIDAAAAQLRLVMDVGLVRNDIDPRALAAGIGALAVGLEIVELPSDVGPGSEPFANLIGLLLGVFTATPGGVDR